MKAGGVPYTACRTKEMKRNGWCRMETEKGRKQIPKYQAVVDFVHAHIRTNRLPLGAKLPTEKELCELLSVSADTVQRAMKRLTEEGTVLRRQGSGCYVARREAEPVREAPSVFSLIVDDWYDFTGSKFYAEGVGEYLAEKGCGVEVHAADRDLYNELAIIRRLREKGVDHILVAPVMSEWAAREFNKLIADGMRFTFLDRRLLGVTGDLAEADNVGGMRLLCEHLIGLGHRNILFLGQRPMILSSEQDRLVGYKAALAAHGLPIREEDIVLSRDYLDILRARLQSGDRPTAVAAVNDGAATYAIQVAESCGLRVPEDLSVTGFDGLGLRRDGTPVLTAVRQPFKEIGRRAAELAYGRSLHPEAEGFTAITLPVELVMGNTTKAPPRE